MNHRSATIKDLRFDRVLMALTLLKIKDSQILFSSAGMPELKDPNGLIFDYPRVEQTFREVAEQESQKIIDHMVSAGDSWRQDRPLEDDITFMVIKAR